MVETVSTRGAGFAMTLAALLVCALPAAAQPSISSVSGSLTHGSTITVSGGSFGTKAVAAPVMWETFDSGAYHTRWAETQGSIGSTNQRHARTTRNNFINFKDVPPGHMMMDASPTSNTWFVSYWFFLHTNFTWGSTCSPGSGTLSNVKVIRFSDPGENGDYDIFLQVHSGNCVDFNTAIERGPQDPVMYMNHLPDEAALNTWHHVEMEYVNSGQGLANGSVKVWLDGVSQISATNVVLNRIGSTRRPLDLSFWDSWSGPQSDDNYYYQDDTYADTSRARVYLCPGSTFATRGKCEMQPPTAWSASSVAVQVNQGALTNGQTAYLYVVNSSGQVNANGFSVIIGSAPDAPAPPQNLRIVS